MVQMSEYCSHMTTGILSRPMSLPTDRGLGGHLTLGMTKMSRLGHAFEGRNSAASDVSRSAMVIKRRRRVTEWASTINSDLQRE
jgi:hypothetical protein